jgi:hypothetical protein
MWVAPNEHRDHHLGLDSQAFLERATHAAHDALLVAADRALRQCGDLVRKLPRPRQCGSARDDLVEEADAVCLLGVDAPPGDHQLHRSGETDDERQPHPARAWAPRWFASPERATGWCSSLTRRLIEGAD